MKKLICVSCLLIMGALTGCSTTAVKETYSLTAEYDSYTMEENIILYGTDDDTLHKAEEFVTITFDGSEEAIAEKEVFKQEFTTFTPESKYIAFDWSETETTLVVSVVTDFKQAIKDKSSVYSDEIYAVNEYYSIEKTAKGYIADGYELVVEVE